MAVWNYRPREVSHGRSVPLFGEQKSVRIASHALECRCRSEGRSLPSYRPNESSSHRPRWPNTRRKLAFRHLWRYSQPSHGLPSSQGSHTRRERSPRAYWSDKLIKYTCIRFVIVKASKSKIIRSISSFFRVVTLTLIHPHFVSPLEIFAHYIRNSVCLALQQIKYHHSLSFVSPDSIVHPRAKLHG